MLGSGGGAEPLWEGLLEEGTPGLRASSWEQQGRVGLQATPPCPEHRGRGPSSAFRARVASGGPGPPAWPHPFPAVGPGPAGSL